jgi:arylsulfatase
MMHDSRRDFLKTAGGAIAAPFGPLGKTADPPNLLFLFPDELRGDWIEPGGVAVRTPNLRRLSGQGVRFTKAVTPSPLCAPARACLASGKEYDRCRVTGNDISYPLGQTTFYQLLRNAGYHVMGCGKFDLHKPDLHWGTDGRRLIQDWGFSEGIDNEGKWDAIRSFQKNGKPMGPYLNYLQTRGMLQAHIDDFEKRRAHNATFPTPLSDEDYTDNWIVRNGLQLLDQAPKGKSWFLQVNFNGPHSPWDITARMEKAWRGASFPTPNRSQEFTAEEHQKIRQNYAAMIENIDRAVGSFLDKVRERGELDRTLVVFSSDHGEMLGDHNRWSKSVPYQPSVGIPLVVWGPGVRKNICCDQPATSMDLTATFLDYAGIQRPSDMDSRSLRGFLEGKPYRWRPHVLCGLGKWRMVTEGRYKYIRGFEDTPLLFDLKNDPLENENIAAAKPAVAARLAQLLPPTESIS